MCVRAMQIRQKGKKEGLCVCEKSKKGEEVVGISCLRMLEKGLTVQRITVKVCSAQSNTSPLLLFVMRGN